MSQSATERLERALFPSGEASARGWNGEALLTRDEFRHALELIPHLDAMLLGFELYEFDGEHLRFADYAFAPTNVGDQIKVLAQALRTLDTLPTDPTLRYALTLDG